MQKNGRLTMTSYFRYSATAYAVLGAALFVAGMAAYVVRQNVQEHEQDYFGEAAQRTAAAVHERMAIYTNVLYGARALFLGSKQVTRREFQTYVTAIDLTNRYPGMQGIGFVRRLSAREKGAFTESTKREIRDSLCDYPDFEIFPPGSRLEYYVIDFIEPISRNRERFGQDVLQLPACREALERARDNASLAMSKRMEFRQGELTKPGFILLLPIYQNGMPRDTVPQRRSALSGYIVGYFLGEELFAGIFGQRVLPNIGIDFEVFDGPTPTETGLLYDDNKRLHAFEKHPVGLSTLIHADLGGQRWSLFFSALPTFGDRFHYRVSYFIMAAGLGLGLLLFRITLHRGRHLAEHRLQADALEYQATHDALTHLANRTQLFECFKQALAASGGEPQPMALLLIDLDGFKEINDTLGHHNGDLLLRQIGPRLENIIQPTDTLARLGGDEFALLIASLADRQRAFTCAQKILGEIRRPFELEDISVQIDASIGVAFFPDHGRDSSTLLRCADIAMYIAKRNKSGYEVYDLRQDQYTPRRLSLMSDLRHALDAQELVLYYQPKINIKTRELVGLEALIRWQHPKEGLIPPGDFIPQVEASALIRPLTLYVMDKAIAQCRRWRDQGLETTIAINISARNLLDTKLPARTIELLNKHDVPADNLEMEITESAIIADPERAFQILALLHRTGVRLSIDDFGTGYSSLAHLKKLPVSALKIDTSFITDMHVDDNDAVIVHSTINLAHNLGMRVVAEGVEGQDILDILDIIDCDYAQGYYICRPQPADAIMGWLEQTNRLTRADHN